MVATRTRAQAIVRHSNYHTEGTRFSLIIMCGSPFLSRNDDDVHTYVPCADGPLSRLVRTKRT